MEVRTTRDRAGRKRSSFWTAAIEAARRASSSSSCFSLLFESEVESVSVSVLGEEEEERARWEGFERRQRTVWDPSERVEVQGR